MKRNATYPHHWVALLALSIASGSLLSCTEQKQDTYPEWLMEYDATFVLPDVPPPSDPAIPPCTCYLSPDGKPIIWIKKKSMADTISQGANKIDIKHNQKGGTPMDP